MKIMRLKADSNTFEVVDDWQHSLENMQKEVGGYIEAFDISGDIFGRRITVWLNEEGKLIDLPPNFAIVRGDEILDIVMGDVIITAVDEEGDTTSLTDEEVEYVKKRFDESSGKMVVFGYNIIEKILLV